MRVCPVPAIVAAFGLDERTVRAWRLVRAGGQGQKVHQQLVQQGQLAGHHIQVDELRVKRVQGIQGMALGMLVGPQLWLGGVVSARRDKQLIRTLAEQVRVCLCPGPVAFDGLKTCIATFQRALRERLPGSGRGRPRLVAWPQVVLVRVIKRYRKGDGVAVEQRIVQGTPTLLARLLGDFDKCQEVRAKRAGAWSRGSHNKSAVYPLSSLLVCEAAAVACAARRYTVSIAIVTRPKTVASSAQPSSSR